MICQKCGHKKESHRCANGPCLAQNCTCDAFSDRIDPSPPAELEPDQDDDEGNPGL